MSEPVPGTRPEGLPGAARVRVRADFLACQRSGLKQHTRHFVVFARVRGAGELDVGLRLGITASRQVGNAVRRNRWKRLVREAFRRIRGRHPASRLDVIVVARKDAEPPELREAYHELDGAIGRLHRARRP